MIESAILTALQSDGALAQLVSTYANAPAIFSESAPEGAAEPYVTFDISRVVAESDVLDVFNIMVDFWDMSQKSRAKSRQAAQRIEFVLDGATLQTDRYDTIRVWYESAGPVPEPDPRYIHHNLQFMARAGRKAWAEQL